MADRNVMHDLPNMSNKSPVLSPASDNEMIIEHNPVAQDDDSDVSDDLDYATSLVSQQLKKPVASGLSMRRLSQLGEEHQPRAFLPPRVNCPEKIILCLDLSSEMEKTAFKMGDGTRQSPCVLLRQALEIFVRSKLAMNPHHSIAVVFLLDSAEWALDFTSDPALILETLDDLLQTTPSNVVDFASLFDAISDKVPLPVIDHPDVIPPPYVMRAILVYGRSHCLPQYWGNRELHIELLQSEYFFLDIFYIHDPPGPNNRCEEIFDMLCDLDLRGTAYVFEVTRNATRLHDGLAKLLAHPLQRTLQADAAYSLNSARKRYLERIERRREANRLAPNRE